MFQCWYTWLEQVFLFFSQLLSVLRERLHTRSGKRRSRRRKRVFTVVVLEHSFARAVVRRIRAHVLFSRSWWSPSIYCITYAPCAQLPLRRSVFIRTQELAMEHLSLYDTAVRLRRSCDRNFNIAVVRVLHVVVPAPVRSSSARQISLRSESSSGVQSGDPRLPFTFV